MIWLCIFKLMKLETIVKMKLNLQQTTFVKTHKLNKIKESTLIFNPCFKIFHSRSVHSNILAIVYEWGETKTKNSLKSHYNALKLKE